MRGRGLISVVAGVALCAHAQTTIDLQVTIDDTYRSGGVSALRADGGVVWHGEIKPTQSPRHLRGSLAGARFLRLEWQRADGRRGRRQQSVTLDERVLGVEGTASFQAADEEPFLDGALMVTWPATLKVFITNRDDATGMATVEIVDDEREFFREPEVRVDRWEKGRWVPAAAVQCEKSEAFWVSGRSTTLSVASMNCVPAPLAAGSYRRVLRLRRDSTSERGLKETLQFDQPFTAPGSAASVVMLHDVHFWSLRQEPWSFATPQLRVGDALICACDGLVVGRERHVLKLLRRSLGYELCAAPPDGGACEDVPGEVSNTGDFPPYLPPK